MKKNRQGALALLLCVALGSCAGAPRIAQDPLRPDPRLHCNVERGIGGTGISGSDRGLGGTGRLAAGDERGMGGPGIGGGIIGTVTGFGSICVSGVRVAYDPSTTITAGNLPGALNELARGMTVAAHVVEQNGELKASRIDILHALVGPITSTTPLTIMGASVAVDFAASGALGSLAIGDMVVVDGLHRTDGVLEATRIARAAPGATAAARGPVNSGPGMLRVGGVAVAATQSAFQSGMWVVASGTWANDRLVPEALSAARELAVPVDARISVEGYLLPQPGGGFGIRGISIRENLERSLARDTIARLAAGQRVQIIGVSERDGVVRPQTIIVPDFSNPLRVENPQQIVLPETPAESASVTVVRPRAAAAAADTATQAREALQLQRGVYGEVVTRPEAVRTLTPAAPEALRVRPLPTRPNVPIRPDSPARGDVPTRPNVPTRPDAPLQRPRGG